LLLAENTLWKVCGAHGNMGLDLSCILIGLHEAKRPKLSGIEIGFLRTVGDIFQASLYSTVMIGIGPKRLAKRDLGRREGAAKTKVAPKLVGLLADQIYCGTSSSN
jgi:hypothetical protein